MMELQVDSIDGAGLNEVSESRFQFAPTDLDGGEDFRSAARIYAD
jgi:hypothetical protein